MAYPTKHHIEWPVFRGGGVDRGQHATSASAFHPQSRQPDLQTIPTLKLNISGVILRKMRLYDWHQKILHFLKQKYLKVFICKQIKINLSRFPFKIKKESGTMNKSPTIPQSAWTTKLMEGTGCLGRHPVALGGNRLPKSTGCLRIPPEVTG